MIVTVVVIVMVVVVVVVMVVVVVVWLWRHWAYNRDGNCSIRCCRSSWHRRRWLGPLSGDSGESVARQWWWWYLVDCPDRPPQRSEHVGMNPMSLILVLCSKLRRPAPIRRRTRAAQSWRPPCAAINEA